MSAKLNKIELNEEFMVMQREEQTLWDVMDQCPKRPILYTVKKIERDSTIGELFEYQPNLMKM